MVDYLHKPVQHEAFFKKYASKKFLKGKFLAGDYAAPGLTYHSIHTHTTMGEKELPNVSRRRQCSVNSG